MRIEINTVTGEVIECDDAPAVPLPKTNAQLRSEELQTLTEQYQKDTASLYTRWTTISATGGTTETTKKTAWSQDMTALKAQYALDKAAIFSKYA